MGAIESLTILSATGPSSVSVSCVINSGADCEETEATLTMSLWRSQPADYAPESRAVILALPKKRPFLPGDFEAKGKKQFSALSCMYPVSLMKGRTKEVFSLQGPQKSWSQTEPLGRELGFPEWSSSMIERCATGLFS